MMKSTQTQKNTQTGFALLMAVLISSVVLAVGLSMLNITLKQYIFSGIGRESEIAFYAADAGMECALYWDASSQGGKFDIGQTDGAITCMGQNQSPDGGQPPPSSGSVTGYVFDWQTSGQSVCTVITVVKYYDPSNPITVSPTVTCDAGATCTQVESRGYNKACSDLLSPRVVERALRANY